MAKVKSENGYGYDSLGQHIDGLTYTLPYTAAIRQLESRNDGLTHHEVQQRLETFGRNELEGDRGTQPLKILLRQIANAMTLVSRLLHAWIKHG